MPAENEHELQQPKASTNLITVFGGETASSSELSSQGTVGVDRPSQYVALNVDITAFELKHILTPRIQGVTAHGPLGPHDHSIPDVFSPSSLRWP